MINHFNYSKRLHLAIFCCFLFPFFYTGCGPSKAEKSEQDKADSTAAAISNNPVSIQKESAATKSIDTLVQNKTSQVDTLKEKAQSLKVDTIPSKSENESKNLSEKICNKFPFLQPILIPKVDTYTGIAIVIDSILLIPFFAVFISFLFLIISLLVKFIDTGARKTIALLDIFALIFLFVAHPYSWDAENLWGYWVSVIFVGALTIYDLYIIKLSNRLKSE